MSAVSARELPAVSTTTKPTKDLKQREVLLKILPAAGGSFIEWYEFAIYSYLASYMTGNFFEGHGGSLGTWAGFAVTFAFRPLGGAVFGWLADTFGRKPAMQLTIAIMLATTVTQGLLPTFHVSGETWGWFGLVTLLVLRALQGLSAGGELSTAAVYISEISPHHSLGLNLSWISVSGAFGAWTIAAMVVYLIESCLEHEQMMNWGWRIPYLTSVVPGFVLIVSRRYLTETEDFEDMVKKVAEEKAAELEAGENEDSADTSQADCKATHLSPFREVLRSHPLALTVGALGTAGIGAMWYVVPIYGVSFIKEYDGLQASQVTLSEMIAFLIPTLLAPPVGVLVDKYGAGKLHLVALVLGCLVAPVPLFYWWTHVEQSQAIMAVWMGQCIVGILLALTTSVYLWVIELFPVHVRATGVSVAYNVGIGIFGGLGPLISDFGNRHLSPKGPVSAPALFTVVCGLVSVLAVVASRVLASRGMLKLTYIRESPY